MARKRTSDPPLPPGFSALKRLGSGEGTVVWAVEASGERFALKLATGKDPARRLEREFAILERFSHPGIVKVASFGVHEGHPYFTMELIEGPPFDRFLEAARGSSGFLDAFLSIFARVLAILSTIHNQGVVHADVKPANLLIRKSKEPVLLDFGFAEDYVLAPTKEPRGTLDYVAPELFAGGDITPAADLYSLGVMAWEVLTGRRLWSGKSLRELMAAKLAPAPDFSAAKEDIPDELRELTLRLLNPEPALRPSAGEAAAVISRLAKRSEGIDLKTSGFAPVLPFGGRTQELALLEKLLLHKKEVVFIEGEPGTGKTRLLREFRFRALAKRRNTILVQGRGPYLSLTAHIAAALGLEPTEGGAEAERDYERIVRAIERSRAAALLVDAPHDLSGYEEEGLGYLARALRGKRGVAFSGVSGRAFPQHHVITLAPLDESLVRELVRGCFKGIKRPETLARTLSSVSGGNPRRLGELLEVLYREGWLRMKAGGWVYRPPADAARISKKLDVWFAEKINALPDASPLHVLALAQGAVPLDALRQALPGVDVQWALRRLEDARLVRFVVHRGVPHYEVENPLIRQYVLSGLPAQRRRTLARALGDALVAAAKTLWGERTESWDETLLAQIAALYSTAKARTKAPSYLVTAGRRLAAKQMLTKARDFLTDALRFAPTHAQRREALLELGRIADLQMEAQRAEEFYARLLPLVKGDVLEEAGVLVRMGLAYQRVDRLEQAEEFFGRAEKLLGAQAAARDPRLCLARGWNALKRREFDEAEGMFRRGVQNVSVPKEKARHLYSLAWALFLKQDYTQALEYASLALEEGEAAGDTGGALQAALLVVETLQRMGRLKEAQIRLERAVELSEEMQSPSQNAAVLRLKAQVLEGRGLYRRARGAVRQALELLTRLDKTTEQVLLLAQEANLSRELGEWPTAEQTYRDVWRRIRSKPAAEILQPYVLRGWARLYELQENGDDRRAAQRRHRRALGRDRDLSEGARP